MTLWLGPARPPGRLGDVCASCPLSRTGPEVFTHRCPSLIGVAAPQVTDCLGLCASPSRGRGQARGGGRRLRPGLHCRPGPAVCTPLGSPFGRKIPAAAAKPRGRALGLGPGHPPSQNLDDCDMHSHTVTCMEDLPPLRMSSPHPHPVAVVLTGPANTQGQPPLHSECQGLRKLCWAELSPTLHPSVLSVTVAPATCTWQR